MIAGIFASTACTHTPDDKDSDGKEFVGNWTVENVVQDDDDPTPANVGGKFQIERKSDNTFRVVPGENFSEFAERWERLEFRPQCGREERDPFSLQERVLSPGERDKRGFVLVNKEIINGLYNELSVSGIQSLVGGPLKIHGEDHTLHFFLFKNKDDKRSYEEEDLLIFFCHNTHCNHNGMIHGDRD